MSDDITDLIKDFIAFRSKCQNPHKDSKGYNYTYLSLAGLIDGTQKILADHNLAVMQFPVSDGSISLTEMFQEGSADATTRNTSNNRGLGVLTILMHKSGQYIRSRYTMPAPTVQGANFTQEAGACITYARRYAMAAVLCLAADEDTDADYDRVDSPRKKKRR